MAAVKIDETEDLNENEELHEVKAGENEAEDHDESGEQAKKKKKKRKKKKNSELILS